MALLAASGVSTGWVVDIAFAIAQVPADPTNPAEWLLPEVTVATKMVLIILVGALRMCNGTDACGSSLQTLPWARRGNLKEIC